MKRSILCLPAVIVGLTIISLPLGCGSKQGNQLVVGFANSSLSHPWRVAIQNAILKEAGKYPDIKVITTEADEDAEKQLSNVEDMMSNGINLLLICTVSGEGSRPIADACKRANLPVVPIDRNFVTADYTSFVGQSNQRFGSDMADWIAGQLTKKYGKPEGIIVELKGRAADLPSQDREKGFHMRVAEKYPGMRILASQNTDYSRTSSQAVMENILQAQKEIDAVYTHEDEIALGAIIAIKEANRLGSMIITGCGGSGAALQSIKDGEMTCCGTYSPIDAGTIGMRVAAAILHGQSVPKQVNLSGAIITRENVDRYILPNMNSGDYVYTVDLQSMTVPAKAP